MHADAHVYSLVRDGVTGAVCSARKDSVYRQAAGMRAAAPAMLRLSRHVCAARQPMLAMARPEQALAAGARAAARRWCARDAAGEAGVDLTISTLSEDEEM